MSGASTIANDLRARSALCEELLLLVERENLALREPQSSSAFEFYQQRKNILPRLDESLAHVKKHRADWQRLDPATRRQKSRLRLPRWYWDFLCVSA